MSEPGGPGDHEEQLGSVSEEAVKLFGALADWARDHGSDLGQGLGQGLGGLADQAAATAREVNEHVATGAAECTYCPICRAVHVVRQTSPEVRAHLAVAASSLLQAAAGIMAAAAPQDAGDRAGGVEHIDLDDDLDDEPDAHDPDPGTGSRPEEDEE